jgi:Hemerythrin HHE cation binding domain
MSGPWAPQPVARSIATMFQIDLPAAVVGFVGVHLGLRAEAAHVERLRDAGDLPGARRRARLLGTVLHHHHHAEDTVLFPALTARQPGVAITTAVLEDQHVALDAALAALPDASTPSATCAASSSTTSASRSSTCCRSGWRRSALPSTSASPARCGDRRRCATPG